MPEPDFEITTRTLDGTLTVAPSGELDLASAGRLFALLREAQGRGEAVDLDLGQLTFMDSTGLALLIEASCDAQADGWALRIHNPSPPVARVIEMTRTQTVLGLDGD
jgi:anti-sigma B factor antagonist